MRRWAVPRPREAAVMAGIDGLATAGGTEGVTLAAAAQELAAIYRAIASGIVCR